MGQRPIFYLKLNQSYSKRQFLTVVINQAARISRTQTRQHGQQVSSRFTGWPHIQTRFSERLTECSSHRAGMQADANAVFVTPRQLYRRRFDQLVKRCLGGPVTVPAT